MRTPKSEERTATQRLLAAIKVLNTVRFPPKTDPFTSELQSEITEENYLRILTDLRHALAPLPEDARARKIAPRRRAAWRAAKVQFDAPALYRANTDGSPTPQAAEALIARARWTLIQLLQPLRQIAAEGLNRAIAYPDEHFKQLGAQAIGARVRWVRHYDLPRKPFLPKLGLDASGVDTQVWLTLLEFIRENPRTYRDLLGVCPECFAIFAKPRTNAEFCSRACANKAAYRRWVRRGGLKRRKRERFQQ